MRNPIHLLEFLLIALASALLVESGAAQDREANRQLGPHHGRVRIHFIAADEVEWNYAPMGKDEAMGHAFHDFEKNYMEAGPHRIGRVYKKAIYREYTDAKFNRVMERSGDDQFLGIVGPTLYGEVGDTLKIVFKNNTSRPYTMHPHGVLYQKDSEGSGYNDGTSGKEKEDDSAPPGGTHIYIWEIPERAGPGPADPSSIVWVYHSHVDEMRDIASGLFGAIVITAKGKARADGHPNDVDREFVSMMISINENESWYLDENIRKHTKDPKGVNKQESIPLAQDGILAPGLGRGFADSNLRYTINGYAFGNMPMMTMKKGERVRWYLALSPAQMETVDMVPDNPGIWLFHCHISDHMAGGMVTRYQVLP